MAEDVSVAKVLDGAQGCTVVLVLGWDAQGGLYAATSTADSGVVWDLIHTFTTYIESGRYG
jgi:hypothetical protein